MEDIGMGLQAIGKAIGACATAYAFIYIAEIRTKIQEKLRWMK